MKTANKIILAVAVASATTYLAAGGPNDYKKTVQRRVAPATVETRIPGRTLVDFGKMAFGFLELVPPPGARGRKRPDAIRAAARVPPQGARAPPPPLHRRADSPASAD